MFWTQKLQASSGLSFLWEIFLRNSSGGGFLSSPLAKAQISAYSTFLFPLWFNVSKIPDLYFLEFQNLFSCQVGVKTQASKLTKTKHHIPGQAVDTLLLFSVLPCFPLLMIPAIQSLKDSPMQSLCECACV